MIHLDERTFQWVSIKRFDLNGDLTEIEVLASLISHPQYRDHYAGGNPAGQGPHNLHGPYELANITTASFLPTTSAAGRDLIQSWADSLGSQPAHIQEQLAEQVYTVLDAGNVYQLPDLGQAARHEWGWVVGTMGFHEFIVIGHDRSRLVLLVASDD